MPLKDQIVQQQRASTPDDADSFLMSGGIKSAVFPAAGTSYKGGIITAPPRLVQQTDYASGEPKFWDDGNPMMQAVVTVRYEPGVDDAWRDEPVEDDDGERAFYIKGQMQRAFRDALKEAGVRKLEVGGVLDEITYTGDGTRKGKLNPPKQYYVSYTPPDAGNDFLAGPEQAD